MRVLLLSLILLASRSIAQDLYFPPTIGNTWETVDPSGLGWCEDQLPPLLDFLETNNTKAFIVLKDGRIAIEAYFGTFTADSSWYWASAGKSLTSFLVGIAQQEGSLDIDAPSSNYLGTGWTSCTPEQETAITIRNQLTMTTGLDDGGDLDCTDPECLNYLAEPGTRWSYHNAPYTLLDGVLSAATGQNLNGYTYNRLGQTTGMLGLYVPLGSNNVFFSTPRSMARFGLLCMNQGVWNGTPIMSDANYFNAMTTPSQSLNEAYGYLWWLNGQSSYQLPGIQFEFPGPLMPDAPDEAFNALGKNGQIINVIPSQGLVVIRMGNLPGGLFVPNVFNNEIWQHLNEVICTSTGMDASVEDRRMVLYPNPVVEQLSVTLPVGSSVGELRVLNALGQVIVAQQVSSHIVTVDLRSLAPGSYRCVFSTAKERIARAFVKGQG